MNYFLLYKPDNSQITSSSSSLEAESEARTTDQGWIRRVCSLAWHIGREDKLCVERLLLCN